MYEKDQRTTIFIENLFWNNVNKLCCSAGTTGSSFTLVSIMIFLPYGMCYQGSYAAVQMQSPLKCIASKALFVTKPIDVTLFFVYRGRHDGFDVDDAALAGRLACGCSAL